MSLVIAFGHRKRTGKDTCATFLNTMIMHATRGLMVKKTGFAYELKSQCHRLYGWAGLKNPEYYDDLAHEKEREDILPAIGKSPRQIWLDYGTLVGREVYSQTWVDYLFHQPRVDIFLVADLRFENEFERVRQMGGLLVRVDRPSIPDTNDIADKQLKDKPDEAWDHIITNDDTLHTLNTRVDVLFKTRVYPRLPGRKS